MRNPPETSIATNKAKLALVPHRIQIIDVYCVFKLILEVSGLVSFSYSWVKKTEKCRNENTAKNSVCEKFIRLPKTIVSPHPGKSYYRVGDNYCCKGGYGTKSEKMTNKHPENWARSPKRNST
jgi:hypothetical protein